MGLDLPANRTKVDLMYWVWDINVYKIENTVCANSITIQVDSGSFSAI